VRREAAAGRCQGNSVMIFRWWRKWDEQKRLAQKDATVLIARYGTRASHIANRRVAMMRNGSVVYSNRPPYHWKRVHSITRQLLPYDEDDGSLEKRPS
jgi:hypothetical protein